MERIPFNFVPPPLLVRFSRSFYGVAQKFERHMPGLRLAMSQAEFRMSPLEYLSMCMASLLFTFGLFLLLASFSTAFGVPWTFVPIAALMVTLFAFMQQTLYPKLVASRRVKDVEKNLLAALQDIYVQLNSGIPLFSILVNISKGDYGEVSKEFDRVVKEVNAGKSQVDALEDLALRNPSVLFRRSVWQLVNGMKEGSDISSLIAEVIRAVSDEQLTQIQRYGGQLSPLALFYMLIAIIAPSLGTTFIIILSSFINLSPLMTKLVFYGLLVLTMFFQVMFLGMIKTRRPSLLT